MNLPGQPRCFDPVSFVDAHDFEIDLGDGSVKHSLGLWCHIFRIGISVEIFAYYLGENYGDVWSHPV